MRSFVRVTPFMLVPDLGKAVAFMPPDPEIHEL